MKKVLTLLVVFFVAEISADDFRIIVPEHSSIDSLTRRELSGLFLRQTKLWSKKGAPVFPVDQQVTSPVREAFTLKIYGMGVRTIKSYWRKKRYSGRSRPPPVLRSDESVLEYVKKQPGSIGYVSNSALLEGEPVKVIKVVNVGGTERVKR